MFESLGHEGGASQNRINYALIKEAPKTSLSLPPCEDTARSQQFSIWEKAHARTITTVCHDLGLSSL